MRILSLRLQNLNSLVGEWEVDLNHPAYTSDGLFAITGATGAGKTTLLDAICLALYGRTPRLNKVTKSTNEIMSRQKGECFAEITFATQAGRYRCHWSQRRARGKPNGELQAPQHEIADANTGKIIEAKVRTVADKIEQVTGMDFDRFTRSMLLAQGSFAVFLQAAPDQRAPILEQITGTDVYSRISIKVHQRRTEERSKLIALQTEVSAMLLLSAEDKQQLQTKLAELQLEESQQIAQVDQCRNAKGWLTDLAALQKELVNIEKAWQEFQARQTLFQPTLIKLNRADKAYFLDKDYSHLVSIRRQQEEETHRCHRTQQKMPHQEVALAMATQANQQAASALEQVEIKEKQQRYVLKKVRELDIRITEKNTQIKKATLDVATIKQQLEEHMTQKQRHEKALLEAQRARSAIEAYLQQNQVDQGLQESLADIRSLSETRRMTCQHYDQLRQELAEAEVRKSGTIKAWQELEKAYQKQRAELVNRESSCAQLKHTMTEKLCGRALNAWRNELSDLKDRKYNLDQLADVLVHIATIHRQRAEEQVVQQSLEIEEKKLASDIVAHSEKQSQLERDVQHLATQVVLLNRIQSLEAERKQLQDGKPCPLCGATEHPFAKGNIPPLHVTELALKQAKAELAKLSNAVAAFNIQYAKTRTKREQLQYNQQLQMAQLEAHEARCKGMLAVLQIDMIDSDQLIHMRNAQKETDQSIGIASTVIRHVETLEDQLISVQQALEKGRMETTKVEKRWQEAGFEKQAAAQNHQRIAQQCSVGADRVTESYKKVLQAVAPFGIDDVPMTDLDKMLENLTARQKRWQKKQSQKMELDNTLSSLNNQQDQTILFIEKLEGDLFIGQTTCHDFIQERDAWMAKRRILFGDKDPDEEETHLTNAVEHAKKDLENSRSKLELAHQALQHSQTIMQSLQETLQKRAQTLQQAEQQFSDRLANLGFAHEADYREACLSDHERTLLKQEQDNLQQKATELTTLRQDKIASMTRETEKKMTDQSYEQLQQQEQALTISLKETQQEIGGIKKQLADDKNRRRKQQDQIKIIETQKKECLRWDTLHELIGSADGKKYRNFAQGLTFELLVHNANRQLEKMTDRYLLLRDDRQPLELSVVDNYQAGEIRSTKNLSGGESFIVSLALALGLSQMASRNVRVDSLFLDEGFGTLDEDTLDTALETLAGLQQDGKLIGVISHVPALKERIGTQIQVTPQAGGRSKISGPGCRLIKSMR